ncbi:hypothetical protein KAU32_08705 [bacterium]|nr:hypothetical protein [bacterium]
MKKKYLIIILTVLVLVTIFIPPFWDSSKNLISAISIKNGGLFNASFSYYGKESYVYNDTHPPLLLLFASLFPIQEDIFLFYLFSSLLYLFVFMLIIRKYTAKKYLIFLVFISPIVLLFVNSFMHEAYCFVFLILSFLKYEDYKKSRKLKDIILSSLFLSFSLLTNYAIILVALFFLIDMIIRKDKKVYIYFFPIIVIFLYILICYIEKGGNVILDALVWRGDYHYGNRIGFFQKVFSVPINLAILTLPILIYLSRKKKMYFFLLPILFLCIYLNTDISKIIAFIISLYLLISILLLFDLKNILWLLFISFAIIIVYPQPTVRNFSLIFPFIIFYSRDNLFKRKFSVFELIFAISFSLIFITGFYDYSKTAAEVGNKVINDNENKKIYAVSGEASRYLFYKNNIPELDFGKMKADMLIATNANLENLIIKNELPYNIMLMKSYSRKTKLPFDLFIKGTFICGNNTFPIIFERSLIDTKLYRVANNKRIEMNPENILNKDFKYFRFRGYSIKIKEEKKTLITFLRFEKYKPIYLFFHDNFEKPTYQKWRYIDYKLLDSEKNVKIDMEIKGDVKNGYILFTDDNLKPIYPVGDKNNYKMEISVN